MATSLLLNFEQRKKVFKVAWNQRNKSTMKVVILVLTCLVALTRQQALTVNGLGNPFGAIGGLGTGPGNSGNAPGLSSAFGSLNNAFGAVFSNSAAALTNSVNRPVNAVNVPVVNPGVAPSNSFGNSFRPGGSSSNFFNNFGSTAFRPPRFFAVRPVTAPANQPAPASARPATVPARPATAVPTTTRPVVPAAVSPAGITRTRRSMAVDTTEKASNSSVLSNYHWPVTGWFYG